MIIDNEKIKSLVYAILDAVDKVSYDIDRDRVKRVLIDYKIIKD